MGSKLDAIYAQLKELQNLKDEICDDLDDFVSEVDHNEAIEMPQHFDQVVDIVVNNERDRAEKIEATASEYGEDSQQFRDAMEELEVNDANPFWQRLLAPEKAYGVDVSQPIAPVLEQALNTGLSKKMGQSTTSAFQNFRPPAAGEEVKGTDELNEEERKRIQAMAKIRQNELQLAHLTKKQHQMKIDTSLKHTDRGQDESKDQEDEAAKP